jgi:hypothetical protein
MLVGYFLWTFDDGQTANGMARTFRTWTPERLCACTRAMFPSESVWIVPGTITADE